MGELAEQLVKLKELEEANKKAVVKDLVEVLGVPSDKLDVLDRVVDAIMTGASCRTLTHRIQAELVSGELCDE